MPEVALWEQILLGVVALVVLLLFAPGLRRIFKETRAGTFQEWMGVITPLIFVVAFVFVLILMVRGGSG